MYKRKIKENINVNKTKFKTINQHINRGVEDEKRKRENKKNNKLNIVEKENYENRACFTLLVNFI